MDEKVGGEAQVCRLCGQFESIYIDVFGDEGTRRLLGLKIHSRINILINENDELPKTVCIRCVGTLEFLCDFAEQCQETQQKLAEKEDANPSPQQIEEEFNKENVISSKHKSLSPPAPRKSKTPVQPSPPCQDLENIPPLAESLQSTPEICENVLSEIPHTKKQKTGNSQRRLPKIRSVTTLTEALSSLTPKSEMKGAQNPLRRKPFPKFAQGLEKNLEISSDPPKVVEESVIPPKPVEIRRSLQKFIRDPDTSSLVIIETLKTVKTREKSPQVDETCKKLEEIEAKVEESVKEAAQQTLEAPLKVSQLPEQQNEELLKKTPISQPKEPSDSSKTDSPHLHKTIPEAQKLGKTSDCTSSSGPSRPVGEECLPKNGSRSSSSQPSKATHNNWRNSESSSNSSEFRRHRRRRSSSESSSSSVLTSTSSSSKRRKSGAIYGTISQLISLEEKEAIEKFYTIDMSVVNDSAVEKKLNHLDKKQTMCVICSAVYPRIDKCRVHVWGHLDMKPYKCTACDFSTVTVTNIRCHIRKSHLKIKPFECNFCKKRYVTAVLLEEHLNTHSGLRPFKCTVCSFSSASRQVLSYHMTTHKPVKDVTCEICGKEFFSKGRMRAHMITHNKNRELMCKYCSHHFSSADTLQKHLDNVHSRDYVCDICGKATKSRKALHNHQNVHSEAKFKCNLCPNVYKSGHILKEHLLKHEGIRKYKCDVCDKDFAQQSHLAAHMAVHSEKRFKCPGCQRAFNRHDNMKIHTKRCGMFKANPHLQQVLNTRIKRLKDHMNVDEDDEPTRREETFSIGQVMVIPITAGKGEECRLNNEGGVNITESVIGLECF
ncbi:zinc finger protein 91 isoform X1 [Diachasma alloeum]|uniref:zinc finger protein 91 isoform X1 n=1 Tax=Diachasma alloeum TaxID=454923 RepID=UPI0007384119|nr:zinc finger protein 91 isoform X1 [Diachasma alloeum]